MGDNSNIPGLGLWSLAETVPDKLGSLVITGDGRRIEEQLTMTQIVSGLVRELDSVKSPALVRNGHLQQRGIHSKKVSQLLCNDI